MGNGLLDDLELDPVTAPAGWKSSCALPRASAEFHVEHMVADGVESVRQRGLNARSHRLHVVDVRFDRVVQIDGGPHRDVMYELKGIAALQY